MNILSRIFGAPTLEISAVEVKQGAGKKDSPLLLDVRQPDEFRAGHVTGAKLIPLNELEKRVGELPRDRKIICICRSGSRSGAATRMLAKAGYDVANMRGGMIAWNQAGLPVKKGGA
jgi:sulfur-carrier protein adenylyltransferase/sulfurtransferase